MSKPREIGTVEVLTMRVYTTERGEFAVDPGTYPVCHNPRSGRISLLLTGRPAERVVTTERIGDGMFTVGAHDAVSGELTTFPQGYWTAAEFAELLDDPVAIEGHPMQRLRFRVIPAPVLDPNPTEPERGN